MSIIDKIKKNSTIKLTNTLSESTILLDKFECPTDIPVLNIALSGSINGGLTSGITIFAGPSKHFKTMYSLILVGAYLKQYPEACVLFYDAEFGAHISYFEKLDIDVDRVIHCPINNVEELKFDIVNQLDKLERHDRVIIMIDSLGNLASKKEVEDSLEGKGAADMTRAKQLKSLFRMITPMLSTKDIPLVGINHIYRELGSMFPKDIMGGGTGIYYSAQNIFFIGRQQEKEGTELVGYNFIINVEKSRFVREKSRIPLEVSFEGGISKYSGLLDIALELGVVIKPSNGWFSRILQDGEVEERKWRRKDTYSPEFWDILLSNPEFDKAVYKKFHL